MKKFLVLMILLAGVVYMLPLGYEHTASTMNDRAYPEGTTTQFLWFSNAKINRPSRS